MSTVDKRCTRLVASSFMVLLTAAGVIYAWLVAFAHSSVNTLLGGAGLFLVVAPVASAYTAGESGLVTMACTTALAAVLLVRGRCWDNDSPVALATEAAPHSARRG